MQKSTAHGANLAVVLVLPMPSTLTLQRRLSLQEHCVAVAGHRGDAMTRLLSEQHGIEAGVHKWTNIQLSCQAVKNCFRKIFEAARGAFEMSRYAARSTRIAGRATDSALSSASELFVGR
jgi:hypothetical protein